MSYPKTLYVREDQQEEGTPWLGETDFKKLLSDEGFESDVEVGVYQLVEVATVRHVAELVSKKKPTLGEVTSVKLVVAAPRKRRKR